MPESVEKGKPTDLQPGREVKSREICAKRERAQHSKGELRGGSERGVRTKVEAASTAPGTQKVSSILAIFYPLAIMRTIVAVIEVLSS